MNTTPRNNRSTSLRLDGCRKAMMVGVILITAVLVLLLCTFARAAPAATDPGAAGPCAIASQAVMVGSLETTIYYPSSTTCGTWASAPFPAVAFAHGFSMFGLSNGMTENSANGEHLASWGYVVAIPKLPDDAETRVTNLRDVLTYLQTQANTPGSFLYQKVDTNRLATAGHSLGGSTALAAAARDTRVKAVVGLDPVNHGGAPGQTQEIWNAALEAPLISVPTGILGAPPGSCNDQADYADIYPLVGATHKASFLINGASHCVFAIPGSSFCASFCSTGTVDAQKQLLSKRYMTGWFNYYLHEKADYYAYLYGANAAADIAANLIVRQISTAPRNFTANPAPGSIELAWTRYNHPVVAGYNIYRRQSGQSYPATPYAQVGSVPNYADTGVVAGQVYSYTVRGRDLAGNVHQAAGERSAVPQGGIPNTPTPTPTTTPTRTPAVSPTPKAAIHFTDFVYLPVIYKN